MSSQNLKGDAGQELIFPRAAPSFGREPPHKAPISLWLLAWAVMLSALLAPALWNGFPIIFADTGGYLARPFEGTLELGRSALYGAFLAAGLRLNFWPVVALQAAIAAWVILLVLRAHSLGGRPLLAAALVAGLCLATSLPWYASQLMPDIFASLAVLALYLLLFGGEAVGRAERPFLGALIAFAIASHMATLALCAAVLLAWALLRPLRRRLRLPPPRLGAPALAVAAGLLLAPASNAAITGQFAFTPGGASFVFGRLIQDGIVERYLGERCPDPRIRLCAFAADLPKTADDWLWAPGTPFWKLGGWKGYEDEARAIILETLKLYPGQHFWTALRAFGEQLVKLRTGEGLPPDTNAYAERDLERLAPAAMPQFRAARQQHGLLDATLLNAIHVPLALFATLALVLETVLGPTGRVGPREAALAVTVLLALLGNAAIAGVF